MKLLDQELTQMPSIDRKVSEATTPLPFRYESIKYSEVQENPFLPPIASHSLLA